MSQRWCGKGAQAHYPSSSSVLVDGDINVWQTDEKDPKRMSNSLRWTIKTEKKR